jgi:hypothetical protein
MKVRYMFDVTGHFRLPAVRAIAVDDAVVTVEISDKGMLRKLCVTYELAPDSELPTMTGSGDPNVKLHFKFPAYASHKHAIALAKNVEDQLCIFGVDSVDTETYLTTWIPESDADRQNIRATDVVAQPGVPDDVFPIWSSRLLRQAVRMDAQDELFRLQLSFYKTAFREIKQWHHATAFIFLFFFVETLFGDSEIKTSPLLRAFVSSSELTAAFESAVKLESEGSPYTGLSANDALDRLIDRRGFLLHNPSKRKRSWTDQIHIEFSLDAMLLEKVCRSIIHDRLWPPGSVPPQSAMHDDAYNRLYDFMSKN